MPKQLVTILSLETIDQFQSYLSARGRSTNTIKAYSTQLRVLLSELEVTEIEHPELEESGMNWLNANRLRVSPKTTTCRLTALRVYGKWARLGSDFLSDYIAPTPAKSQPHPIPEGINGVRRLLGVCNRSTHQALVALLGLEALRISEALAATASWFDVSNMELVVRGKGDKTRRIPISSEAWQYLQMPVLVSFTSGDAPVVGLKDRFARKLITTLGQRADLTRMISSHDLRATCLTALYNKTKDQRLVQEFAGHASGDTTQLYIAVAKDTMRQAIEL